MNLTKIEGSKPKKRSFECKIKKNMIPKFEDWLKDNGLSYNTRFLYVRITLRILYSDKNNNVFSSDKINNFLSNKNNIPYQSSIKKFIEFLNDEQDFDIPKVKLPGIKKEGEKVEEPLTIEELNKLIECMPNQEGLFKFRLITELLVKSGMRISEIVGLRIGNIDFVTWMQDKTKNGKIKLTQTKGNVERFIPISSELMFKMIDQCEDLTDEYETKCTRDINSFVFDFNYNQTIARYNKRWKQHEENLEIFAYPKDMWDLKYIEKSVDYYTKILSRVGKKALNKKVHAHLLRHSYASHLDSKGVRPSIIQKLLGHSSLEVTSRYLHPSKKEMMKAIIN